MLVSGVGVCRICSGFRGELNTSSEESYWVFVCVFNSVCMCV